MTHLMKTVSVVCALALLCLAAAPSQGGFIVSTTVEHSGDDYNYNYTLTNDTNEGIFVFDIEGISGFKAITAPLDWSGLVFQGFDGVQAEWGYVGLVNSGLVPSMTLNGFKLTSSYLPADITYSAIDGSGNVFSGKTIGPAVAPSAVPEPSSLILGIIGGIPIISWYFGPCVKRSLGKIPPLASPLSPKLQSARPLIARDLVARPVVELRRLRRLVSGS